MKKINLNAIRIDGGTQSREAINNDAVQEYADAIRAGAVFPPLTVYFDGADYWLADGFHRYHAHRAADRASVDADVRDGTCRDAVLHSLGANTAHGLRRTNADKRKAVETMLRDPEWVTWSDHEIGRQCGVSQPFVGSVRRSILNPLSDAPAVRTVERGGKTYPQDTTNIGRTAEPAARGMPPKPPEPEPEDFGPTEEELAAQARADEEELAALRKLAEADDKLAHAMAENARLRAMNRVLEERVNGLMAEKAEAIKAAKRWQRKAEQAERASA